MRLAIFGTGGMGRELADIVQRSARIYGRFENIVFIADMPSADIDGITVLSPEELKPTDEICFAVGSSTDRRLLAQRYPNQPLATIVSDSAIISPSVTIGAGTMIYDFAVINNSVSIGRHFLANCYAQVSHDCIIGDYVTLSPKASCNGWVKIEDDVFVGAGAVIRNGLRDQRLTIGQGALVGMNSTVLKDIPAGEIALGTGLRSQN